MIFPFHLASPARTRSGCGLVWDAAAGCWHTARMSPEEEGKEQDSLSQIPLQRRWFNTETTSQWCPYITYGHCVFIFIEFICCRPHSMSLFLFWWNILQLLSFQIKRLSILISKGKWSYHFNLADDYSHWSGHARVPPSAPQCPPACLGHLPISLCTAVQMPAFSHHIRVSLFYSKVRRSNRWLRLEVLRSAPPSFGSAFYPLLLA